MNELNLLNVLLFLPLLGAAVVCVGGTLNKKPALVNCGGFSVATSGKSINAGSI